MKARIEFDRALGNQLERNHIALDDAIDAKGRKGVIDIDTPYIRLRRIAQLRRHNCR